MSSFMYKGRDRQGRLVSARVEAASEEMVLSQLSRDGITPVSIEKADKVLTFQEKVSLAFGVGSANVASLIIFARQMQTLSKSGVPLIRSIQVIQEACRDKVLKEALTGMILNLESGQSLAVGMQMYPTIFNTFVISMINVGENTGNLDQAFEQVSYYLETEKETKKRMKAATRYPMTVLIVITIAIGIINIMVVPSFKSFFAQFGAELPLPTRILMATSDFTVKNWPWLLLGIIVSIMSLKWYIRSEGGRMIWDRYKLRIPLVGKILNHALLARFCRTFSMSLKAGVPLLQALTVVSQAVDNRFVSDRVLGMRSGVERGEPLMNTAKQTKLFTPLVLQMLLIGEETGDVDGMLKQVADTYEDDVDYDLKRLGDAIEPILICVIAGIVLVLALGVFLPMWDMSNVSMKKLGH